MFSPWQYLILMGAAFMGGFVDSVAGGGGIITLPTLLAVGIPAHAALATNKVQSSFGSCMASVRYAQNKLFDIKKVWPGILFTAIGASIGTIIVRFISADFLNALVPILLLIIFVYMLFSPELGKMEGSQKLKTAFFYPIFGLTLGFYDGFFGPGAGSFWTIGFILLLGHNLKTATGHTKMMNFTSNFISLVWFLLTGKPLIIVGICMGLFQLIGAFLGTAMVIRYPVKWIRTFFLVVVFVTIVKLFLSLLF